MECAKCVKPLPVDGRYLTCTACRKGYHLGKACSGVADSTFSGMGAGRREGWKCPTCRTNELHSGAGVSGGVPTDSFNATDGSLQNEQSIHAVANQLASINLALQQLLPLKASVETLLPLPAKVDQLLSLKHAVQELRNTVGELQSTVESFSGKYDSILALVKNNEESVKSLQTDVHQVKIAMNEQSLEIARLKEELNDAQQYSRRCNMEIQGLPLESGEDLFQTMIDLSKKLCLPHLDPSDIVGIHRLARKRDLIPHVLVSFASVEIKETWMAARGGLRRLSRSEDQSKLFFNDHLTKANKELFWLARTKGREKGYQFVWVKNAKIYARKREGAPALRISTNGDLEQLT